VTARPRGNGRNALWEWTPHGAERTAADNPRSRRCPTCHAEVSHGCVSRTRGRTPLVGYHDARLLPAGPGSTDAFCRCGECGHVYATAEVLVEADYAIRCELAGEWAEHVERRDPDQIPACPFCSHDF
jgi:hypothetical protein